MLKLTQSLITAFKKNELISEPNDLIFPANYKEAEEIQDTVISTLKLEPAGWKLGASNYSARNALNLQRPFSGLITAQNLLSNDVCLSRGKMDSVGVECELVAVFGETLPVLNTPYSADVILNALEGLGVGIEIPQTRYLELGIYGGLALVADNGAAHWGIRPNTLFPAELLEGKNLQSQISLNGNVISEGDISALVSSPIELLTDHVNRMAFRGYGTQEREVIFLGSLTPYTKLNSPGKVVASIENFGDVSFELVA